MRMAATHVTSAALFLVAVVVHLITGNVPAACGFLAALIWVGIDYQDSRLADGWRWSSDAWRHAADKWREAYDELMRGAR